MTITSNLRFLYIFGGSGLLCAGPENAEAYVALAFSTLSIGCTLEKLCQDLGDIQWEIVSPTPSNSGMYEYSILY